ncbi:ubiquinol-cytochrome C chaperone family protein [Hoeflea prorocentri]|uniref:Ubiquinol-cytochrome C chaperone n=1 Tax=Hoeflea prorocentri TaxID=1922333 RepID=A0A9X3UIE3_9HYPH|nr:ubiquinol-cytochrome C chaperone family protein [Hoeflea prorocentri]MCY6381234.1 ubiquinol-cytochrome C chaperone [Hoeflea prorocentri]MDA5399034.1 ubiquinol-cytochrome C chaperone [Hoeflea prorocentri]
MIFGYFSRKRKNREIVDRLYRRLTAIARNPAFYARMHVPDTVMGRFEMLSVVMVLFFRRTDGKDPALQQLAQDVVDTFFEDMDHSLRELGIGDQSVPKRMKKLARMFYGRAQSYGTALNEGAPLALSAALHRNIYPQDRTDKDQLQMVGAEELSELAQEVMRLDKWFLERDEAELLAGQLTQPDDSIVQENQTNA